MAEPGATGDRIPAANTRCVPKRPMDRDQEPSAPRDERFGPLLRGDEWVGTTSPNDEARLLTGAGHVGSTGNKRTKVVPTPGVDWTSTIPLWL